MCFYNGNDFPHTVVYVIVFYLYRVMYCSIKNGTEQLQLQSIKMNVKNCTLMQSTPGAVK